MRFFICLVAAFLTLSGAAAAQSVGLFFASDDYSNMRNVRRSAEVLSSERAFEAAGMQVISRRNPSSEDMLKALVEFDQAAEQANTLLIVLSGHFVHTDYETYYLASDARPGPLSQLPLQSVPLSSVMAWLAQHPKKAVLVLSTYEAFQTDTGFISGGIGLQDEDIPEGVTVLLGAPRNVGRVLSGNLSQPGRPFVGAARQRNLVVAGYAPDTHYLLETPVAQPRMPTSIEQRLADISDWRNASRANTAEAYQSYLRDHPNGEFARMAQNRIQALTDTPEARAERAEQSLDLSRDARRSIQRNLTLLGFNTRGIDGIFGRGTRAAVTEWQRAERFDQTGFLTGEQIAVLSERAKLRAQELEAEAERRRQEQLTQDLAYWDRTGALGDEAGLRSYLQRFPDGEYSELARQRLGTIEERKRARADRFDRQLWENARAQDTARAYQDYLAASPQGAFRDEAEARITSLENRVDIRAAAQAEIAMGLSPRTRQVVEARLKGMGLNPGPVDGDFTKDTRRAIRRYQTARNMEPTGYLSDRLVVQLMADSVRQIFK